VIRGLNRIGFDECALPAEQNRDELCRVPGSRLLRNSANGPEERYLPTGILHKSVVILPAAVTWTYDIRSLCLVEVEVIFVVNTVCDNESVHFDINWAPGRTQVEPPNPAYSYIHAWKMLQDVVESTEI